MEPQTIIGLNVEEKIALKISMCTSSLAMIQRLETLYGNKSQASKEGLRDKFFTYTFDGNKTVTENCLEIDGLAQEARALGEELKDEWVVSKILSSLPESYQHFRTVWDSMQEIEKTLSKLIERLQQEEQRTKNYQNAANAFMIKGKGKPQAKKGQENQNKNNQEKWTSGTQSGSQQSGNYNNCFKCGKPGHKKAVCHGKPCQAYIDYCKKNYKCNNCNQIGHFAKECTNEKKLMQKDSFR